MKRHQISWGRAVSTTRGGSAFQSLIKAVTPVTTSTRILVGGVEYDVSSIEATPTGGVTIQCMPHLASTGGCASD